MNKKRQVKIVPAKQVKLSEKDLSTISMEQTITKYCGQDWLMKLEQITGAVTTIEMPRYKEIIDRIITCEKNINILFKRLLKNIDDQNTSKLSEVAENFAKLSSTIDLANKSTFRKLSKKYKNQKTKPKVLDDNNSTEHISNGYTPAEIIMSEWMRCIKSLEYEIYHVIEKILISPDSSRKIDKTSNERKQISTKYSYEAFEKVVQKFPNLIKLHTIFNIEIRNQKIFESFMGIHKYSNIIINSIMTPLYDVKGKVSKSYDTYLAHAFKAEITKGLATKELIINLLTEFVTAKYRAAITGNNKYFFQMLSNEITEGMLSTMDGARFIEIMDSINTEQLDKTSKAVNFTIKAKEMMKKILDKSDRADTELIFEIQTLFDEDEPKELMSAIPDGMAEAFTAFDSILALPEAKKEEEK